MPAKCPPPAIWHGHAPLVLAAGQPLDLAALSFKAGDETLDLDRYLQETVTDGFIVLHHGRVV